MKTRVSYDIFSVPEMYRTALVLIIAPYFDPKFAGLLTKALRPEKVRLVIDDGVRMEDVPRLTKVISGAKDVKVALSATSGLVHIKGYYIEFVKVDGKNRRKRRFFYGSANATDAAFNGRRNAELVASVDLSVSDDRGLLDYLAQIVKAVEAGSGQISGKTFGPLRNSPILHLPSFRIIPQGPAPGFDAWLQRGRLAAKHREAQQFLKVSVVLKKRLPQDVVATVFASRGLVEVGERNIVRFRYISVPGGRDSSVAESDELGEEAATSPQWKSRYCTWTHLGDWLSDECHNVHGDGMVLKSGDARGAQIHELLENGEHKIWIENKEMLFSNTLGMVWNDLSKKGVSPEEYLQTSNKDFDRAYYQDILMRKIQADYRLAQDSDFCNRYIKGYEFPAVPRFRQDAASWDAFVRSWCESVALEVAKRSPRSLLAQTVNALLAEFKPDADLDPEEIGAWLRKSWEDEVWDGESYSTVGTRLANYYLR